MRLCEALDVHRGDMVSLVGAGGKTTAMFRLGRELADQGLRVVATTTTMIRPPLLRSGEALVVSDDSVEIPSLVSNALRHHSLVALASRRLEAVDKLKGIEPGLASSLFDSADVVIVEADGARGLPIKAPAPHEPVLPLETTLLVPVVGADAIGSVLTESTAHRPERISDLTGLSLGEEITTDAVARLLVHPRGAFKTRPSHARVSPLINKADCEPAISLARQVAMRIKCERSLARVVIGAVTARDPVIEAWRHVSIVLLAAGGSTRFGAPKQLVQVGDKTLLEHGAEAALAASADQVVVVLGHRANEIAPYVPKACRVVINARWEEGISTSIRAGLASVDAQSEAALFVLADQPLLGSDVLERVLRTFYASTCPIIVTKTGGVRGTPALFARSLFSELALLEGDIGGRAVIACHANDVVDVPLPEADVLLDIDTPADYARMQARLQ